jgi:hypothetical protein
MLPGRYALTHHFFPHVWIAPGALLLIGAVTAAVFIAPNTEEVMRRYGGSLGAPNAPGSSAERSPRIAWAPTVFWGLGLGAGAAVCILLLMHPNVFLYYNF